MFFEINREGEEGRLRPLINRKPLKKMRKHFLGYPLEKDPETSSG